MEGPHTPLSVQTFDHPTLQDGEALLQTVASEVCGTDVHMYEGRLPGNVPFPIIPGHVSVGKLVEKRGSIVDIYGRPFELDETVAFMDVIGSCGACKACLEDRATTRCPSRKVYGITLGVRDGLCGGWSEGILLKKDVRVLRLPEGLPPETYIGGGCGLNTAAHAIEEAQIQLGDSVAVLGVGPVGQSILAFSRMSGAGKLLAIGAPQERLDFAKRMGADETCGITPDARDRISWVMDQTDGFGADVVLEATGDPHAVTQALDMVRNNGTVVVVGQYTDNGTTPLDPFRQVNRRNVRLRGSWGSDYRHFARSIRMMGREHNRFPWHEMAQRKFGLDAINEALRVVRDREVVKAVIVP